MVRKEYARDFVISAVLFVIGAAYLVLSQTQIDETTDGFKHISGRTFPYIIGGTICLLNVFGMLVNWRGMRQASHGEATPFDSRRLKRAAIYAVSIAVYGLMIAYVGYLVSTFIALAYCMRFSGAPVNKSFIAVAIIAPPLMYYLFHILMQIPLPDALLI